MSMLLCTRSSEADLLFCNMSVERVHFVGFGSWSCDNGSWRRGMLQGTQNVTELRDFEKFVPVRRLRSSGELVVAI